MVDEIRPGNFVFYDLMQYRIGSCSVGQIAVAMACLSLQFIRKEMRSSFTVGSAFFQEKIEDTTWYSLWRSG